MRIYIKKINNYVLKGRKFYSIDNNCQKLSQRIQYIPNNVLSSRNIPKQQLSDPCQLLFIPDFITIDEEQALMRYLQPHLVRRRYQSKLVVCTVHSLHCSM